MHLSIATTTALCCSLVASVAAGGNGQQYPSPADQSTESFSAWHEDYVAWIEENSASLNLQNYDLPEVMGYRTNFIQPQVMMHDKFLYDRETDTYTVDKFLDDVQARYGGVDSVLLWPTYPNIGVDDRNQYEMHESLPGGLDALKDLVDQFHARNVLVLLPLNPWDHGTNDSGMADYEALIQLIQRVGADGFNGDTMNGVNSSYWNEAISEYPIIIEPETMSSENAYESDGEKDLETNLWSWGYWQYESAPSVAAYKALTGGKHLTHICERWATDHTQGIQNAFFNGAGFESWENVWGIFNKMTDRNAALLERASKILRSLGDLLQGGDPSFIPHIPVTNESSQVYSTLFKNSTHKVFLLTNSNSNDGDASTVSLTLPCRFDEVADVTEVGNTNYTIVPGMNCYDHYGADDLETPTGSAASTGLTEFECSELCTSTEGCTAFVYGKSEGACYRRCNVFAKLCVDGSEEYDLYVSSAGQKKLTFLDLYNGMEMTGSCDATRGEAEVEIEIEGGGIGAVIVTTEGVDDFTKHVMGDLRELTKVGLGKLDNTFTPLQQTMVPPPPPPPPPSSVTVQTSLRGSTVSIPAMSEYDFECYGNCIEGDPIPNAVDVQFPWEATPGRDHFYKGMEIGAMKMDKYPVTNADYAAFLSLTGWEPENTQNWLLDWVDGMYVESAGNQPVTWVSHADAEYYCSVVGGRLPTSYEWQYAGQGLDGRLYPWGNDKPIEGVHVPEFSQERNMPDADEVNAHSKGASPFGVEDMCGNVYQWTSVFSDEHTNRGVLRGGSRWRPEGSDWYLPEPRNLGEHDTFLMMSESMDRSKGIGFRCVSDDEEEEE